MNILIIKPSSLGDVIHALPFLKAVKDRYPDDICEKVTGSLKELNYINDDKLINMNNVEWIETNVEAHRVDEAGRPGVPVFFRQLHRFVDGR